MRRLWAWFLALVAIGLAVWAVAGSQRLRDCLDAGGLRTLLVGALVGWVKARGTSADVTTGGARRDPPTAVR
jgi:hypothetical protein